MPGQVDPHLLLADEVEDDDDDYVPEPLRSTDKYESEAWCRAFLDRSEYEDTINQDELEAVVGPLAQALVTPTRLRPRPPTVAAHVEGSNGGSATARLLQDDIIKPMMSTLQTTVFPIARNYLACA